MKRLILVVTLLLALLPTPLVAGATRAATAYTIADLGTLGGRESFASALNASGHVVGQADTGGGTRRAFLHTGAKMADLGALPGYSGSAALDINDAGSIVGYAEGNNRRPVLWREGVAVDLGTPAGSTSGTAAAINGSGQIVGSVRDVGGTDHAALWQGGRYVDLVPPLDSVFKDRFAMDINAAGTVAGAYLNTGNMKGRGFVYRDGTVVPLERFSSLAYALNDVGQVVGGPFNVTGMGTAFLWQDGVVREVGTLPGTDSSAATAINASGQVVGVSYNNREKDQRQVSRRAFLWQDGVLTDLSSVIPPDSGWLLNAASAINDRGQIAGSGTIDGNSHAFLLTPVVPTAPSRQCFPETGKCVQGRFLVQWQQHGGLAINGYPIGDESVETLDDGHSYTVQYFERVRMEYHPEAGDARYQVLLGQFGRRLHPADPAVAPQPGATHFPATGHNIPPDFAAFWGANGGLAQFGFPLSEVFKERLEDGKEYEVQYFERARLERHPENAPPANILIGQFGRRIMGAR